MISERRGLLLLVLLVAFCLATPTLVYAADGQLGNSGIMNEVLDRFHDATSKWLPAIQAAASRLFLALAVISMVWTFGMLLMRKADIGEFFTELIRFMVVFGFYWWLLTNAMGGLKIADTIVQSMSQLGASAGKLGTTKLGPSTIVDLGFELYDRTVQATDQLTWREMGRQLTMEFMAIAILLVLAIVAINLLVLLASSWFLLYAGIFFLGFGGSRWTSDIALNYFRAVLGVGAQLFAMVLLIAIGKDFLRTFADRISNDVAVQELAVMLVVSVLLLFLVNKIPPMIASLVGGAGSASSGIGNFGAGAAVGAASTAASFMSGGASALMSGAASLAGGVQSMYSAFKSAQSNVAAGTDIASRMSGMLGNMGGMGSSGGAGGPTPLGSAMGLVSGASASSLQSVSSAGGESAGAVSGAGSAESSAGSAGSSDSSNGGSQGGSDSVGGQALADGGTDAQHSGPGGGGGSSGGAGTASPSKMGTAGRIALDMGANLAAGMGRMAQSRIDKSTGGQLATAVSNAGANGNSARLDTSSSSRSFDPASEVAAYRDSKQENS
ncbi:P-type conjugative transfer protein TrbL [Pseudomonas citronellolis]|uniref:P-type conjugative transfer protein TrbL n=1 Tax=Pseudomonas citronellolis TaxID=53408 RepID=UPI0026477B5A|nr:P-type conjugative transfer protein TrbL [Pseudomonas citronellolis]MDN6874710.1 P-type conjugative transfer protein TrbL [Pseudomonas citronellolis]